MAIIICSKKQTTKKFKQAFLAVMHWYNGFPIYLAYLLLTFRINNPSRTDSIQILLTRTTFITSICLQPYYRDVSKIYYGILHKACRPHKTSRTLSHVTFHNSGSEKHDKIHQFLLVPVLNNV